MRDKDVIQHIQDLCKERSWTYYRLAKEADIPYSTLNNMVNRTNIPTIPTLQKLCDAFASHLPISFSTSRMPCSLPKDSRKSLRFTIIFRWRKRKS